MDPRSTIARPPVEGREDRTFQSHLQAQGLRMTRERRRVLDEVLLIDGHFRPDDLLVRFRTNGVRISRATIYRTLDLLVEAGLVRREAFPDAGTHYERAHRVAGHAHHDHLYCVTCGAILEFHNEEIERLQEKVCRALDFEPLTHSHQISGRCGPCRRRAVRAGGDAA
ncbi:MAG: Fur family transcriptional regulator [Acidobacteriota bacterium]